MKSTHFSFVPPYEFCRMCLKDDPGRRLCATCNGARLLVCTSCNGLASLPCPDCDGFGKLKSSVLVPLDNTRVLGSLSCQSCISTGKVHCDSCIGIGGIRCSDCRGLGHIKCDCSVSGGYAKETL